MFNRFTSNDLDIAYLLDIAEKKFLRGHETIELMEQAGSEEQRALVALVALMEVEESLRFIGLTKYQAGFVKKHHRLAQEFLDLMRSEQRDNVRVAL